MANFEPLKRYILKLMDEMIDQYNLTGPFLDAGCGIGDVSLRLAKRGWEGLAVDFSPEAIKICRKNLQPYKVRTEAMDLFAVKGEFKTIVMTTVIEHIKEDTAILKHLRTCYPKDGAKGYFIVSMPTNPKKEWRWDDDFYGHYRRYEKESLEKQLASCGFKMLEFWNYTFPVFWALRRVYTRILPKKIAGGETKEENTSESSLQSAWDMGKTSTIISKIPIWPLIYAVQKPFKRGRAGFEAIVLAETV